MCENKNRDRWTKRSKNLGVRRKFIKQWSTLWTISLKRKLQIDAKWSIESGLLVFCTSAIKSIIYIHPDLQCRNLTMKKKYCNIPWIRFAKTLYHFPCTWNMFYYGWTLCNKCKWHSLTFHAIYLKETERNARQTTRPWRKISEIP